MTHDVMIFIFGGLFFGGIGLLSWWGTARAEGACPVCAKPREKRRPTRR
jgi:hypothetical protein